MYILEKNKIKGENEWVNLAYHENDHIFISIKFGQEKIKRFRVLHGLFYRFITC